MNDYGDFSEPSSWAQAAKKNKSTQSIFSEAADVFRNVVPQEVRDVLGRGLRAATSAEYALNLLPFDEGRLGTDIGETLGKIPYAGGLARTTFDIGASPANILTAGLGAEALLGSRAAMVGGRLLGATPEIGSTFGGRLLASTAAGVGGVYGGEAGQYLAEKAGLPEPAQAAAGFAGGLIGGGLGARGVRALTGAGAATPTMMAAVESSPYSNEQQFQNIIESTLPKELQRSAPGYFSQKIDWGSDIEKALYIVGNPNRKSSSEDKFMQFLSGVLNMDENEVRSLAKEVRANIISQAKEFGAEGVIPIESGSALTQNMLERRGLITPIAGAGGIRLPVEPPTAESAMGGIPPVSRLEQYGGSELSEIVQNIRNSVNESAELRKAGGIAEQELAASRSLQGGRSKDAVRESVEQNLSRDEAQELYSNARYLGGAGSARQTYAAGFDLTDEMWRKINAAVSKMAEDGIIGHQDVLNIMGTSGSAGTIERLAMGIGPFNNYDIKMIRTILGDEVAQAAARIPKTPVTPSIVAEAEKVLPSTASEEERLFQRKAKAIVQQQNVQEQQPYHSLEQVPPEIKALAASSQEEIQNATPKKLQQIYEAKRIVQEAERATTAQSTFFPEGVPINPPGFAGEGGLERAPFAEGRTTPRLTEVESAELIMRRLPGESDADYQMRLASNYMLGEQSGYRQPVITGYDSNGKPVYKIVSVDKEPPPGPALSESKFGLKSETMPEAEAHALRIKMYEREIRDELEKQSGLKINDNVWDNIVDALGSARVLMASGDLSFILRQASMAAPRNPELWAKSVREGVKAYASEEAAILSQAKYLADPMRHLAERGKLAISRLGKGETEEIFERRNTYASKILEKIPLLERSERAYITSSNELRMGMFKNILNNYYTPEKLSTISDKELQQIAGFVNAITGRGNIPERLEQFAPAMNALFFSPRNLFGRVEANLSVFSSNPVVRKEAAKSLISYYGTGVGILGAAKIAGLNVGTDPNSSDFGKIKLPSGARIDIWGGNQQIYRLISNMASGEITSTEGIARSQDRATTLWNFLHSKMAPVPSAALDLLSGKDYLGRPETMTPSLAADKAIGFVMPLFAKDLLDELGISFGSANKKLPTLEALGLGVGGFLGVSGNVNEGDVAKNTIRAGGYNRLSGTDQLDAIKYQAWKQITESRPELANYGTYRQWQVDQIDRLTKQYQAQGFDQSIARAKAANKVGSLSVANLYSNKTQLLEKNWIKNNPEVAMQVLQEDENQPMAFKRLHLSNSDISALNRSLAGAR